MVSGRVCMKNYDKKTVEGFGDEWSAYTYSSIDCSEIMHHFKEYFDIFPLHIISKTKSIGFDGGCGSGRWAKFIAPLCLELICIDASKDALDVARTNLVEFDNCTFENVSIGELPFASKSMDFGYSLGVIHHIPNPQAALNECCRVLKSGAPFLLYLYYKFDNRSFLYRYIWRISDFLRVLISRLPFSIKLFVCNILATLVYFPLARISKLLSGLGIGVDSIPLAYYKNSSFYIMRNDALDRFGTRLEIRFSKKEIETMLQNAGFIGIKFSSSHPYWCAVAYAS